MSPIAVHMQSVFFYSVYLFCLFSFDYTIDTRSSCTSLKYIFFVWLFLVPAPRIVKGYRLEDVVVRPREDVNLTVNFSANPPADIIWSLNDSSLYASNRISIRSEKQQTRVRVAGANVSDDGTYELKLSNSYGLATTSCNVKVQGNHVCIYQTVGLSLV